MIFTWRATGYMLENCAIEMLRQENKIEFSAGRKQGGQEISPSHFIPQPLWFSGIELFRIITSKTAHINTGVCMHSKCTRKKTLKKESPRNISKRKNSRGSSLLLSRFRQPRGLPHRFKHPFIPRAYPGLMLQIHKGIRACNTLHYSKN